jgi:cytoskeletal protein CcmA (bactofilin family)
MANHDTELVHLDYNLVDTTFDRFTEFSGELRFEHSLKINGKFKRSIKTTGFLYIGESAEVEADIEAEILILEGQVRGNIVAHERAELLPTARLFGDLVTAKLQICDGVVFDGKCHMIKESEKPKAQKPEAAQNTVVRI